MNQPAAKAGTSYKDDIRRNRLSELSSIHRQTIDQVFRPNFRGTRGRARTNCQARYAWKNAQLALLINACSNRNTQPMNLQDTVGLLLGKRDQEFRFER